jgi:hypothetical protein
MTKHLAAVVAATFLWAPQAGGHSILPNTDWQGMRSETYLPGPGAAVPWFNIESPTKLLKGDMLLGRYADGLGALVLQRSGPNIRISSKEVAEWRIP